MTDKYLNSTAGLQQQQYDPFKVQVGGDHYSRFAIQPLEYIEKNKLPFADGCVVKYITRWRFKNGVEDLRKAKHFIEMLIALEEQKNVVKFNTELAMAQQKQMQQQHNNEVNNLRSGGLYPGALGNVNPK